MNEMVIQARMVGQMDYNAGRPRIPAASDLCMALIEKFQEATHSNSIIILQQWIRGWDEAQTIAQS